MSLEELLTKFKEKYAIDRVLVMSELREYVRTAPIQSLLPQIKRITDPQDLNILIGVGMRGVLYLAVIAQKAYIEGIV